MTNCGYKISSHCEIFYSIMKTPPKEVAVLRGGKGGDAYKAGSTRES